MREQFQQLAARHNVGHLLRIAVGHQATIRVWLRHISKITEESKTQSKIQKSDGEDKQNLTHPPRPIQHHKIKGNRKEVARPSTRGLKGTSAQRTKIQSLSQAHDAGKIGVYLSP